MERAGKRVAAIVACQSLAVFVAFYETILVTLHSDELNMKAAQMDPTQIIAVPLEMKAIRTYFILSFFISGFSSLCLPLNINGRPKFGAARILATILVCIAISLALFSVFVLCGAPLTSLTSLTAMSGVHMLFQVFAPAVVVECLGSSSCSTSNIIADCSRMLLNLLGPSSSVALDISRMNDCTDDSSKLKNLQEGKHTSRDCGENDQNRHVTLSKRGVRQQHTYIVLHCVTCHSLASCALGNVLCAILCILDWGVQVQRWPIPILLGTTVGHFSGTMICIGIWLLTRLQRLVSPTLRKFYDPRKH